MFEQLSGLSDLNSDVTDRNVEDILKEAEELIDNSSSSKFEEFKAENDVLPESRLSLSQRVDIKQSKVDECVMKNEETSIQRDSTSSEQDMLKTAENLESLSPSKKNELKLQYLPKKQTFLPGNSINHIKSTIDSLKEFSCAIEKQFSERQTSPSSSSSRDTNNRLNICRDKEKEITVDLLARTDNSVTKSCSKTNLDMPKSFKSKDKGEETLGIDKSLKILNCFERLYKDRPLRLSGNVKKPIKNEKISRLGTKKKVQSFKPSGNLCNKNNKNLEMAHEVKKKPLAKNTERCREIENLSDTSCSKELQPGLTSDKQNEPDKSDFNFTSQMNLDNYCKHKALSKEVFCTLNENHSPYVFNPHKTEEKLLWKLLEDMTEIKE
ncbi:hypothetical protein RUM44_008981 [Polyplax serrata]|uniref:Uncharacterized protein n=1 Tax=Polyplax serrata TaxID=468196 RepID=A0ABR1ARM7_POLSC